MATHDYSLANQSGASCGDLNNALSAIASNNSSSTDPATTFAHQFYYDTGDTTFKIRNAANSAYINISAVGGAETANFGLALAASPSFTGTATFAGNVLMSGTGTLDLPVGTTAQRPSSPNNGMIRYNSTLSSMRVTAVPPGRRLVAVRLAEALTKSSIPTINQSAQTSRWLER